MTLLQATAGADRALVTEYAEQTVDATEAVVANDDNMLVTTSAEKSGFDTSFGLLVS